MHRLSFFLAAFSVVFVLCPQDLSGYSVLAHQAIIDSAWEKDIRPLLLRRFGAATPEQLQEAHAHAYGGCIIQDMGYYPFSSRFFSDLVHYVRAGDFIETLIDEAKTRNEYAFALGSLAHYAADNTGHPMAVNRAVAIIYPKLRSRFGEEVTYADKPSAHLKTEFGLDVVQVARGHYPPQAYREFIGFEVSRPVLERAFRKTYSIELTDLFADLDRALGSYRRNVSNMVPLATRVAWQTKKGDIEKLNPSITRVKFVYALSRADFERQWGTKYQEPGALSKVLAFLLRVVPKVGPLKALAFKLPPPEAEKMFLGTLQSTTDQYRGLLRDVGAGGLHLENKNFDTGRRASLGDYALADAAYAKLLGKLAEKKFASVTAELCREMLSFYGTASPRLTTEEQKADWIKTKRALEALRATRLEPIRRVRK